MAKKSTDNTEATETEKKPKLQLREQNGVTEPREGSKTRRIWDIANEIGAAKGSAPTLAEVKEKAEAEDLNAATIQTQYNRWRKFYNLPPQGRKPKPAETEAAE